MPRRWGHQAQCDFQSDVLLRFTNGERAVQCHEAAGSHWEVVILHGVSPGEFRYSPFVALAGLAGSRESAIALVEELFQHGRFPVTAYDRLLADGDYGDAEQLGYTTLYSRLRVAPDYMGEVPQVDLKRQQRRLGLISRNKN